MRPTLSVLSDDLIREILDEAKRIMAETGMEIRGEKLRQRLLDHGLKTDASGKRIMFTHDVVDAAIESARRSRLRCTTGTATRSPRSAATMCTTCRAPVA